MPHVVDIPKTGPVNESVISRRSRAGVLLLVVLSMLTLFMLLGVTYLVLAARTRATSRAFLKIAGDQSLAVTTMLPMNREAALQVIRGTTNTRSAVRFHDLLADKYGKSTRETVSAAQFAADNQLLIMTLNTPSGSTLAGCVLTFLGGPAGVKKSSVRIADAVLDETNTATKIWVPRPTRLVTPSQLVQTLVLVNDTDFSGAGFSASGQYGTGRTSLNDSALQPNRSGGFSSAFDSLTKTNLVSNQANEDYDALDEQNMALAWPDGSVKSFERRELFDVWIRDYARRVEASGGALPSTRLAVEAELRGAILAQANNSNITPEQAIAIASLRRASMRPFAFDHYQDASKATDFAGRSLASLSEALTSQTGDVDNDGDGVRDSVWLDIGAGIMTMSDRTVVKPLFAVHCVDLGGRLSLAAHGSLAHANETAVTSNPAFAPRREDDTGQITQPKSPTTLRSGLGFGPADVRLDAVIGDNFEQALMYGANSVAATQDGVRREISSIVGRYGDGVQSASSPAFPGIPNRNDRRESADRNTWTDRGIPDNFWTRVADNGTFLGAPPDMWSRLSVGIDHRGNPYYANRSPGLAVSETTDNPYEIDLFQIRAANGFVPSGATAAAMDKPDTSAELEAILRPFDIDNASVLPPRGLAVALQSAASPDQLTAYRMLLTTDTWDTPAVIAQTDFAADPTKHDPDLLAGLKMDINRPFGDTRDNDSDDVVDEPGETGDDYAVTYKDAKDNTVWQLTRGALPASMPAQPGPAEPLLRARQLFAYHMFSLLDTLSDSFAATGGANSLRLFGITSDNDDADLPVTIDPALTGNAALQEAANKQALAQWCVNVVDFLDSDAIMTPFRFKSATGTPPGNQYVVWGCEQPDLMITETLAFHDRRTADTRSDSTGESTADFVTEYTEVYDAYMSGGQTGPYPNPLNSDNNADADDMDFDQVRIPEGSLFLEFYGTRNPNLPNLPRELYTYDNDKNGWFLDVGRVPTGGTEPIWRLSISENLSKNPVNDVFTKLKTNPDTQLLTPGTNAAMLADTIAIDRYVWFCNQPPPQPPLTGAAPGPTLTNTFYRRDSTLPAIQLRPGGYLVVGPRELTAIGSIDGGSGGQKWGVPSKQQIALNPNTPSNGNPAVGVSDLKGSPNPSIQASDVPSAKGGNPLPPPDNRTETLASWVAMDPPTNWTSWNTSWKGIGSSGIGLNVSEPLAGAYYPRPTHRNPANDTYDAYGPLDSVSHTLFLNLPLDRDGGPLADKLLSGGTYANFCTVFVERLADPTRPHNSDPNNTAWNPYIAVDFMPVDLTVFNGESVDRDPSETQGEDRLPSTPLAELPVQTSTSLPTSSPEVPLAPANLPLPVGSSSQLAVRHTYFHTRQRGFGSDLPDYDNYLTLFGAGSGRIKRNPHPFKPVGSLDDLLPTPEVRSGNATDQLPGGKSTSPRSVAGLTATEKSCFRHELGQSPATRTSAADWTKVPFHSLGWVNSAFGRRLDTADGIPAAYAGAPDRPFPWLVWNDRPFANPYELIYVPRTAPGRLLTNYRNLDYPMHADYHVSGSYNPDDMYAACTPGAHLLPITSITDTPASGSTRSRNADLLTRVFEYVRVRSPFTGVETVITGTPGDGRSDRLVPPFNRISKYREPGKININTIYPTPSPSGLTVTGSAVWSALCGDDAMTVTPSHRSIVASGTIPLTFTPSELGAGNGLFRRPYRSAAGNRTDFSEIDSPRSQSNRNFAESLLTNPACTDATAWFVNPPNNPASLTIPQIKDLFTVRSATLLRDGPVLNGKSTQLFPPASTDSSSLNTTEAWANDASRNTWFRFETLVRANANATVRSEVYAIWVTMGLFEVKADSTAIRDPGTGNQMPLYPDGYRLIREYKSDTGDVTRHRSFYIFDRSIPVGYETGSDHNVQDAILVERAIE